jgi:hypothetical protein
MKLSSNNGKTFKNIDKDNKVYFLLNNWHKINVYIVKTKITFATLICELFFAYPITEYGIIAEKKTILII